MHVRIAWEIYNHQQKQKGDKKPGDNPLVPSTSSSSLSSKTPSAPTTKSAVASAAHSMPPVGSAAHAIPAVGSAVHPSVIASSAPTALPAPAAPPPHQLTSADVPGAAGHKRPATGAPPIDFLHKRPTTDADLLRNQLFAPPRPPNPLDPLSNPLLQRPPYLSPFGPSPLRKCH